MSNEYLDIAMEKVINQEINAVLDKIRDEIANEKGTFPKEHYIRIIDKYKGDKE